MIKLVILLSIFSYVRSSLLFPKPDGRIVGGLPADILNYPWQISLQYMESHLCGGSIFNDKIIVTAAHCLENMNPSALQIRAGSSSWNKDGVVVKVAKIKIHENYSSENYRNDVGVILLISPLPLGSNIQSIPLTTTEPAGGTSAVVTGWGVMKQGSSSLPEQLQYVKLNIVNRLICKIQYKLLNPIEASMICAGANGKDSCQGDSGGPLVVNGTLVGIVSWGQGCAQPFFSGVYANVFKLRMWITENAKTI
ncbi:trypsin delta-like [Teleopsis dalmanni]|uniref:trypsin delta-like n=1 Tax=Teleopsis dalmanni TaxID=139649 RepID=UPI0018CDE2D8|nr:trypsin delta-like [Teleopsis dalmanni]